MAVGNSVSDDTGGGSRGVQADAMGTRSRRFGRISKHGEAVRKLLPLARDA